MGQLKSFLTGNKESLGATTLTEALVSLHHDHWFKKAVRRLDLSLSFAHALL
jgi:hypothetical protein